MAIDVGELSLPGLVTLLACYQMTTFARKVGESRRKFKLDPPRIDGPDEFQRVFRAQQNCIEFFGLFLAMMWCSAIFFHPIPASVAGLYYMYGRHKYFQGYIEEAKKRVPGFYMCVTALKAFLATSALGLIHAILLQYFAVNLKVRILQFIYP